MCVYVCDVVWCVCVVWVCVCVCGVCGRGEGGYLSRVETHQVVNEMQEHTRTTHI